MDGALAPVRSVRQLLEEIARQLQRGFRLDAVGAVSPNPSGFGEPVVVWSDQGTSEAERSRIARRLIRTIQHDVSEPGSEGWLFVPMSGGNGMLGAVAVKRTASPLLDQEQEVLRTAVGQASVAFDNLRLESEHRQRLTSYARQVTSAHEEEQRRIARELHDGVAQALSGLCRGLDLLRAELQTAEANPDATAAELRTVAEDSLQDIRRVTRDLRPTMLDDLGLVAGVEWVASDLADRSEIDVRFRAGAVSTQLSEEQELTVFRVAQEAVRNVEKHANAHRVDVVLSASNGAICMQVIDDGCGFVVSSDVDELASRGAYGLLGMRERAELSGGSIAIDSAPGKGTTVTLTVVAAERATDRSEMTAERTS